MKDLNKTISERATRFLPVDMKDRLKSAFNRNAPNAVTPETTREDETSEYNAIFNANRPAAAPKAGALNVPLVGGPIGNGAGEGGSTATKTQSRRVDADIEDAEIVDPTEDGSNASSNESREAVSLKAEPATEDRNSKHEDTVSQKSKSRFFGDFSSTESVRLKVENRNEKRATEPPPMQTNGSSHAQPEKPLLRDDSHDMESAAKPNFVFEAPPAELQKESFQDSETLALQSTSSERPNIILQEEYETMDAKAHESENGATADVNGSATFAAAIVIERSSKFSGQLKFAGAITIEGQVEGDLTADRIVISEGGIVNAAIDGTTVVIAGTVKGDIRAHNELEILPSGIVDGSVTAPAITVRRGGRVEGRCTIGVPRQ